MIERTRLWLLGGLIIFLPLSAWLVSLTGSYLISLGRDLLLTLILLASLSNWRTRSTLSKPQGSTPSVVEGLRPNGATWLGLAFIIFVLASYFVRQDSVTQWLRGVRYLIEPIVLLLILQLNRLPDGWQRPLGRALAVSLGLVVLGGLIDYFFPSVLRLTFNANGSGYLGQIHYAAAAVRLQSTLAGPNALGLLLMVGLLLAPFWQPAWPRRLAISLTVLTAAGLILTFSRSSWIGLAVGLVYFLIISRSKVKNAGRYLAVVLTLTLIVVVGLVGFKPAVLTRFSSNDIRLEQYHRIWLERGQIGLLGRGAGTAGLVSEFSFDNSPNYFSENSYLDVYENVGLFGALAYLALWVWLVVVLAKQKTLLGATVSAAVFGLAVAGLFIDHYTGQAAIWLTLMLAGLAGGQSSAKASDQRSSRVGAQQS